MAYVNVEIILLAVSSFIHLHAIVINQLMACKSVKNQRWPQIGLKNGRHLHLVSQHHVDRLPLANLLLNGFVGVQERRLFLGLSSLPTAEGGREVETHAGKMGSQPANQPDIQTDGPTEKQAVMGHGERRERMRERDERETRERSGRETRDFREECTCSGRCNQQKMPKNNIYTRLSVERIPVILSIAFSFARFRMFVLLPRPSLDRFIFI